MRHRRKECTPLTIQSETPACSGRPNLSEPSSSCKRWDSPDCKGIQRHSVTGCKDCHCAQPLFSSKCAKGDKMQHIVFTLCRAHLRGGNPDNAGTESTGERSAPPVCSGERSARYYKMSEITAKVRWCWCFTNQTDILKLNDPAYLLLI